MSLPHNVPYITRNFTYAETIKTDQPLDNTPNETQLAAIRETANRMELVRSVLGNNGVSPTSWFRSSAVNTAVGGSHSSEHRLGRAVDFRCPGFGTPRDIVKHLATMAAAIGYNQLILELKGNPWVHISFPPPGVSPKLQVLTYKWDSSKGKYSYFPGIQ